MIKPNVIVFSADWCGTCKALKTFLTKNEIEFDVLNIDTELGMRAAKELGIKNIPVTLINNEMFIGNTPDTMKKILEKINE